jgi:hypothetical protein
MFFRAREQFARVVAGIDLTMLKLCWPAGRCTNQMIKHGGFVTIHQEVAYQQGG